MPQPISRLAGARLFYQNHSACARLAAAAKSMLSRYNGAMLEQLTYAMDHPSRPLPVIGTNNLERVQFAAKAADIMLEREDWYALLEAAQGRKIS